MPRDREICWKVREGMAIDPSLDVYSINIDCVNGVVRLNGLVDTADARSRAAAIAGGIEGVRYVDNSLTIPLDGKISDKELKNSAMEAINRDAGLDLKSVEVEIKNGNAVLMGEVPSAGDRQAAEEAIERIKGINSIRNELKVGTAPFDSLINHTIEDCLFSDPELAAFNISAYTEDGLVLLQGMVDTPGERLRAEKLASLVPGVKEVENRLNVKP